MCKKSLLMMLLLALFAPWAANAQTRETLTFNFEDQTIPSTWTNDATYPWVVTNASANAGTYSIKSGNSGVNSSTSTITATYTFAGDGSISFAVRCSSEQTNPSYDWDYGTFYIDGVQQGSKIINSTTFSTLSYDVEAGEHTFMWKYKKDSSVGSNDDCLYVDDVVVDLGEVQAFPKPTNLAVSNILHNSATLSWTENGTATAWQIGYTANGGTEQYVSVTENPYTLTDLTPLTTYEVRVQADYQDNTYSLFSNPISFSTTAVAEAVGDAWSDDFEGTSCDWELINGTLTNAWAWGTATSNGGTHALYVSNDGGTTNAYTTGSTTVVYATKLLNFTEGKFEFAYNWMANGEGSGSYVYDYLRVALVPASVTLTAGTSVPSGFSASSLPTGWIAVDGGSYLNGVTAWQSQSVAVNVPAGNYYMVLAWRNDYSGGTNPPAAVDNVSITRMACSYDVTDLAVNNITTTSATLTWTAGEATQWQVAYANNANFENATEAIVSAASYNMTGLQPSSVYYAKVRAYCGGEDFGAWCNAISIATECEAITTFPWTENFNSLTAGIPTCWDNSEGSTSTGSYKWNYYATGHDGAGLRFNSFSNSSGNTNFLKTPTLSLPSNQPMQLSFWYKNPTGGDFSVYISTDGGDTHETALATGLTGASTWTELVISLADYAGQEVVIVFKGTSNYGNGDAYIYLDDVVVELLNNCRKPSNFAVSEIANHSAVLSWTENGEATAWNLKVNGDLIENVTDNPYTLTNLIPETEYKVQVCPVCEVEKWSDEITFTTDVACPAPTNVAISNVEPFAATVSWNGIAENYNLRYRTSIKYLTVWEDDFENGLDNWTIYTEGESPNPEGWDIFDATNISATNHSGSSVASSWSWSSDAYDADNWLITPQLDLQGVLKFWEFTNSGYPDSYEVLLSTTGNSISDFTITLREMQEATGIWSEVIIDLSSYVGQKGYIAIHHVSYDANYLFIDDFGIYSSEAAGEWIEVPVNAATTYTIQNLDDETQYDVQVQAACGGEDGVSVWVDGGSFTTPSNCGAPTNLAANNVTVSSATLSWEGFHDSYNLQYRTPASRETYYFNDFNDEQSEGWTWSEFWIYGFADPIYNISGSENYFMQMGWNSTAEETIISCELPAYERGAYVEFYYFGYQVANTFQVGYSTTTNDAEAFTWGDPIDAPLATYTRYQETLADGVKYVAFKATASSQNACVFIDDFGIFGADIPAGAWQTRNAVTSPYSLTGLANDTEYEWQVQGINTACEGGVTEWSNMANFTTLNACMVPVIDSVNNVEATTATVYWTGNQESYNVRYGSFETATSINFNDGVIPASMTNDDTYPWTIVDGHIQSGNAGVASSTSSISFTTTLASDGVITFDAMFRGEGSGQYIWDKCIFSIDGTQQFSYGAVGEEWYNMAYIVAAGTHTFTWSYSKDSSTDPEGDFFAIDNIKIQLHNDTWTTVENVAGNSYDMTGLAPESVIAVQVQGVNDVCDGGVTEWSSEYLFITPEQTIVTQTIALASGWNFISFNVETTLNNLKAALVEAVPGTAIKINDQTNSATYNPNNGRWTGRLTSLNLAKMYKIEVNTACEISLEGMPIDPANYPATIISGANWIAYPLTQNMTLTNAFAGFASTGDQIKSQTGSSSYVRGRWTGTSLTELQPGKGYVYISAVSDQRTFVFPAVTSKAASNGLQGVGVSKKAQSMSVRKAQLKTLDMFRTKK